MEVDDEEEEILEEEEIDVEGEEADLHYSVEGLGQYHEIDGQNVFIQTEDSLDCLRDVQRFLRKSDDIQNRTLELKLGEWETLQKRLLPLLLYYREDNAVCMTVLKLLVILTRPLHRESKELTKHLRYLQDYKECLLNKDFFVIMMSILMDAVNYAEKSAAYLHILQNGGEGESSEREKIDHIIKQHRKNVELVLTLLRHILEVPDPKHFDGGYSPTRSCMQVSVIQQMQSEGILDLLILFAEQLELPSFQELNWLIFEIFYHICAAVSPTEIVENSKIVKIDLSGLIDKQLLISRSEIPLVTRHSRFGTLTNFKPYSFPVSAIRPEIPKTQNARRVFYRDKINEEKPNVFQDKTFIDIKGVGNLKSHCLATTGIFRELFSELKVFFDRFIESVFEIVMRSVLKEVASEKPDLQEYDMVRVLNLMAWILEFQRLSFKAQGERNNVSSPPLVRSEENIRVFDVTSVQWAINREAVSLVTKQLKLNTKESKTLKGGGAVAVIALRTLLQQLKIIPILAKSTEKEIRDVGGVILDNILFEDTGDVLVWIMRNFHATAHDPRVLSCAVECIVSLIKSMELLEKISSSFAVKKKKKKKNRQKSVHNRHKSGGPQNSSSDSDTGSIRSEDDLNYVSAKQMSIESIVNSMSHQDALRNLVFNLVGKFSENCRSINHCTAFVLFRISTISKFSVALFFQLSYFVIFHRFLIDPRVRHTPTEYEDLTGVCVYIVKKFFDAILVAGNSLAFVELLFPRTKSNRSNLVSTDLELEAIINNYQGLEMRDMLERLKEGTSFDDLRKEATEGRKWTEDEDKELIQLWEEFTLSKRRIRLISEALDRSKDEISKRLSQLGKLKDDDENDEAGNGEDEMEFNATTSSSSSSSDDDDSDLRNLNNVVMGKSTPGKSLEKSKIITEELNEFIKNHDISLCQADWLSLGESIERKYRL